ncbi:MAG: hypothetical protein H7A37_01030 [Chlamydiales bacterium]|nr:hypothetical protein [Chlamydiia bacterium]MCP5506876.1 hypothetical protein [Chlamydiales bacterium]
MSIESNTVVNPTCTVVFDIDEVLVASDGSRNDNLKSYFRRKGHLIEAHNRHFVFPGVAELFQRLNQEPNVRLAYFRLGYHYRDAEEFHQLFHKALVLDQQLSANVKVCDRREIQSGIANGLKSEKNLHDLTQLVDNKEDLDNTALIVTDTTYIERGQTPNLLLVSPSTTENFCKLPKQVDQWDSEGYFLIPVHARIGHIRKFLWPGVRSKIAEGKCIRACPLLTGGYKIAFKKRGKKECIVAYMNEKEYPDLCNMLANHDYFVGNARITNGVVLEKIHEWIEEHGGECKIKKVYYNANRIYYIAGVLFTALKRAQDEHRSLSSVLRDMQFVAIGENTYEPKLDEMEKEEHWYHLGLSYLQEMNPKLRFNCPYSFVNTIMCPITEKEDEIINQEQEQECVIM